MFLPGDSMTRRKPPKPPIGRVCGDCKSPKHTEVYCPGLGFIKCAVCGRKQREHELIDKPCIAGIREGL